MSQENVEIVRAFWGQWTDEGWTVGAWRRGEADLSLIDPEVVYEDNNLPDHIGEAYRGHEGVIRAAERWTEPFESMAVELERVIDLGDELVSFHRWRARFLHTGIEIDEPLAYRWRFRDGKVIYFRSLSPGEADEAAGPVE
jgi:ketosteroid isomerase-like protein